MLKIALAGAANTGKSELAAALTRALQASGENAFVTVTPTPERMTDLAFNNLTLLMGLNTRQASACASGTLEAEDLAIRTALANAGVPYQVIYGEGEERLAQALQAAQRLLLPRSGMQRPGGQASKPKTSAWVWMCDKCSDPQCEHRLLTALLAQRNQA
ncbi:MAG: GTPase [Polaromonas sp.]|nr:GTPase [Polaromonas sp.]